jgi:hypothetical protein
VNIKLKLGEAQKKHDQAKQELRDTSRRAALIREAISYLQAPSEDQISECPLCGHKAPNLLDHLRKEYELKIANQTQQTEEKIRSIEGSVTGLDGLLKKHKDVAKSRAEAEEKLSKYRIEVMKVLGRKLGDDDEPSALLSKELEAISEELKKLAAAVKRKQERLTEIERDLDKINFVEEILELEQKKAVIENIKESPEFKNVEDLRNDAARLVDHVKAVKAAIAAASNKAAKDKISSADKRIDSYFRKLTDYPELKKLKMTVEFDVRRGNTYLFTTDNGQDVRPILSQGDLNALALSIFLGLACAGGDANPFGFVILDDFSQSLGTKHKTRLAVILNEVLATKRLLLSTMDAEMHELLDAKITKKKKTHIFGEWTPVGGPFIESE